MSFKQKLNPITMQFNLYNDGGSVVGSQISGYGSCETSTPTQIMAYESGYARYANVSLLQEALLSGAGSRITGYGSCQTSTPTQIMAYESGYARYANVSQLQSALLNGAGSMITGYSQCETSSPYMIMAYESGFARYTYVSGLLAGVGSLIAGYDYCQTSAPTQVMVYESGYARYTGVSGIVAEAGSLIGGYQSGSVTGSDFVLVATGTHTSPAMKMRIGDFKQVVLGSTNLDAWMYGGSRITGFSACSTGEPEQFMAYEEGHARYCQKSDIFKGAGSIITGYNDCSTGRPSYVMAYESGFSTKFPASGLGSLITGIKQVQASGAPNFLVKDETGGIQYANASQAARSIQNVADGWDNVIAKGVLQGNYITGSKITNNYFLIATGSTTAPVRITYTEMKQLLSLN